MAANDRLSRSSARTIAAIVAKGCDSPLISGSLFIASGSRTSRYYQPLGRLSIPLQKHVQWNTEWRWYGYGEQLSQYEGFRAHIFMTGLKLIR